MNESCWNKCDCFLVCDLIWQTGTLTVKCFRLCWLFIGNIKAPTEPTRASAVTQNTRQTRPGLHCSIKPEKGRENCPFFNGCFEVKRIIISLEVLKFPRRNPTVLLVLRLLSFYTFDRLPGASLTPKLMANGEKVKRKTWLIIAITPADTNYQWL